MNTLLVGYDLNTKGQKYDELIEYLKGYGTYWHNLDSTWLIKTTKTHVQVRDELRNNNLIDGNDEVLVIDVTSDAAAWYGFTEKASQWLKNNL